MRFCQISFTGFISVQGDIQSDREHLTKDIYNLQFLKLPIFRCNGQIQRVQPQILVRPQPLAGISLSSLEDIPP